MESSLGVLENIGKKTMSVIIDKDPEALAKKRQQEAGESSFYFSLVRVHGGIESMELISKT